MSAKKWMMVLTVVLVAAPVFLASCAPAATPVPEVVTKVETKVVLATPIPVTVPEIDGETEVRIGGVIAFSGRHAAIGQMSKQAIELAQRDKPTVLGVPVRLIWEDSGVGKTETTMATSRAIEVDKAHVLLGYTSSSKAMAARDVSEPAGIPLMSTYATNPSVCKGYPLTFRTCFNDGFVVPVMAQYFAEDLGCETAAVLTAIDDEYCIMASKLFVDAWTEIRGADSIVAQINCVQTDEDFTAQLAVIKESGADCVWSPVQNRPGGILLRQAWDMGLTPGVYFGSGAGWDIQDLLDVAGPGGDWARWSAKYHPDAFKHPEAEKFLLDYRVEYGEDPTGFANEAYDGYMLYLEAIEKAGSLNGEAIAKALTEIKDWWGVSGMITMGEDGDPVKDTAICGGQDGVITFYKLVEAS